MGLATQPISQNYSVQRALALVQRQQEEDQLAEQIATLEAGNPAESLAAGNALYPQFTSNVNQSWPNELIRRSGLVPNNLVPAKDAKKTMAEQARTFADLIRQFRG